MFDVQCFRRRWASKLQLELITKNISLDQLEPLVTHERIYASALQRINPTPLHFAGHGASTQIKLQYN